VNVSGVAVAVAFEPVAPEVTEVRDFLISEILSFEPISYLAKKPVSFTYSCDVDV